MKTSRRRFLSLLSSLASLPAGKSALQPRISAQPSSAVEEEYKALVCIFLYGGNDSNNMIIPYENAEYQSYAAVRGTSSGVMIAQNRLLPISPLHTEGIRYGLHPNLTRLHQLWQKGSLAVVCNTGSLRQPTTKAQYQARTVPVPDNLFSHSDQQNQWQSAISSGMARTGWGGRIAELLPSWNREETFPAMISTGGSALYTVGETAPALAIPTSGRFGLNGYTTSSSSAARYQALSALLAIGNENELLFAANGIASQALQSSEFINSLITTDPSGLQAHFPSAGDSLSQQLLMAAKLISSRKVHQLRRQIFFCSQGGYDTHNDQIQSQGTLFTQLDSAMKGFQDAVDALGLSGQVTAFTLSDFGRTFRPSAGQGSDHGWGSHHLLMGGAVRGGDFYGRYPTLALGGPDDSGTQGRWIPTTSIDQYAATLAKWFGVIPADLNRIFPNLNHYPVTDLGFLG